MIRSRTKLRSYSILRRTQFSLRQGNFRRRLPRGWDIGRGIEEVAAGRLTWEMPEGRRI